MYILRELSRSYPKLWIRIFDADGEFLLIEAASVVPKWLNPTIDSNRAWVHDGKLFIIPLSDNKNASQRLSLRQAVDRICAEDSTPLLHSEFVEAEAFYRLEKYPEQIHGVMHHALVTIPRRLAYVLHERPRAVAPAVEEIYVQDLTALRVLLSPAEKLQFPPRDLVTVSVRFTKVLFAQLLSQRFEAPPAWSNIIGGAQKQTSPENGRDKGFTRLEMGMKLCCGFEMLTRKAEKSKSRLVQEVVILLQDLEEDGEESLPTDQEIKKWENVDRDDDDSWMDIEFEQLENELQGRKGGADGQGSGAGFGDAQTQVDLRKMVSRFEEFLNDDVAGVDGAEVKDMYSDSDEELDSYDDDDGEEDREVSFDEKEFSRMMREMMCLAPEEKTQASSTPVPNLSGASQDKEDDEIRQLAAQMEAELQEHSALRLEPTQSGARAIQGHGTKKGKERELAGTLAAEDSGDDQEVDVDYNLAKNMLESFRGQAGLAGPAGNLLSMLGLHLPRDEGGSESDEEEPKEQKQKP